jgi:O-antigen ligase
MTLETFGLMALAAYAALYIVKMRLSWRDTRLIAGILISRGLIKIDSDLPRTHLFFMRCLLFGAAGLSLIFVMPKLLYKEGWSFFRRYPEAEVREFANTIKL